jgi:hypothetical protein
MNRRFDSIANTWNDLNRATSTRRLALILGWSETEACFDPARHGGLPIVSVLREAGFHLDVALPAPQSKQARTRWTELEARLDDVRVVPLEEGAKDWGAVAREHGWDAVYSNVLVDGRLHGDGVGRFSLVDFDVGIAGALSTARHIVEAAELPFFKKYGATLSS